MSTSADPEALGRQLRTLGLGWRLALARAGDPTAGDAAILELELRRRRGPAWRGRLAREVAERLAEAPEAAPLAQQIADVALGRVGAAAAQITVEELSQLTAQVAVGAGAQIGELVTGDIAGRDIIKVTIHVHGERRPADE